MRICGGAAPSWTGVTFAGLVPSCRAADSLKESRSREDAYVSMHVCLLFSPAVFKTRAVSVVHVCA